MSETMLQIGDQVRLRRRGGAVARVYEITDVEARLTPQRRLFRLESPTGHHRTAFEDDLVYVPPKPPHAAV